MITLHTFGPQFGLPDPSPFVTKADVMLKIAGVPYKTCVGDLRRAPKGKMPFIEDDGQIIGDSTLIRLHVEKKYGVDFDQHLTPVQRGTAWAIEKMLEDHLYWIIVQERWMDDANFAKGPKNFFNGVPALIRPVIVSGVRRRVRKNLHAHGIGRHTKDEATALAARALDSVAAVLGENTYLLGAHKCGADPTAFAFIVGVLSPYFTSPMRPFAERHANLTAYCDRMRREFYPS